MKLEYNDFTFSDEGDNIRFHFLKIFYFDVPKEDLQKISDFKLEGSSITFDAPESKVQRKFNIILSKGFENLKSRLSGGKAIYIHQNSGIPLIGANSFGLVDRDTNTIELKPITGCNLNCIFCSVDEGKDTKKKADFVVEKDYLFEEFKKLAEYKNCNPLYAYINVHGEPLLYSPIVELVRDLKTIPGVIVGIISNGMLLSKNMVDELSKAGLDRVNISLMSMDETLADRLAGTKFPLKMLLKNIEYANTKLEVVVAPVYMKGLNDGEIGKIIEFVKSIRNEKGFPILGIQNFLRYKLGRNPVKQLPWEDFDVLLKAWEEEYKINLREDSFYKIFDTKKLPKPFRKDDIVEAEIVMQDRYINQSLAIAKGRVITIYDCSKRGKARVKIIRDKHNIFVGSLV